MYLEKITLLNFKNYEELALSFSQEVNLITGLNGSGKTNLLDAIYYLCISKSAFNSSDAQNIMQGTDYFMIGGNFIKTDNSYNIQCSFKQGSKKVFKTNKNPYVKISEHIGQFPAVLITPYDNDLIREGSEERRKFFDSCLSQINSLYLNDLIRYNQVLKQRNGLLKLFHERGTVDKDMLEAYDVEILGLGKKIYQARKDFIKEFTPLFNTHYKELSEGREEVSLEYASHLNNASFESEFKKVLERDIILERTTKGIHRDDFLFKIGEFPIKSYGSQGQQKSFVISLKLAEFDIIKQKKGFKPLLLLDDIFDKLDENRIKKLLKMVAAKNFGQLFITDARVESSGKFFEEMRAKISIFKVEKGKATAL